MEELAKKTLRASETELVRRRARVRREAEEKEAAALEQVRRALAEGHDETVAQLRRECVAGGGWLLDARNGSLRSHPGVLLRLGNQVRVEDRGRREADPPAAQGQGGRGAQAAAAGAERQVRGRGARGDGGQLARHPGGQDGAHARAGGAQDVTHRGDHQAAAPGEGGRGERDEGSRRGGKREAHP